MVSEVERMGRHVPVNGGMSRVSSSSHGLNYSAHTEYPTGRVRLQRPNALAVAGFREQIPLV